MKPRFTKLVSLSTIALIGLLLTSCASNKAPEISVNTAAWKQNQTKLNTIDSWRSEGRIAVSKKNEGESASFIWNQFPEQFLLKLFGPFGSGAMELEGTLSGPNKQVILRQGNKTSYAVTAEDLLYKQVKWRLPISGLKHWVKGVPIPDQPTEQLILNADGTLKKVNQLGWEITYSKYSKFENIRLPSKIHLQNNDLEVKLVIRSWSRIN